MRPIGREHKYDTRLDRFRVREGIGITQWSDEAGLRRTTLNRYRSASEEPTAVYLANLVQSASRILGRPVKASELYDLGEAEPLGKKNRQREYRANAGSRKFYKSRLDVLLRRIGLPPSAFAREANISAHTLLRIRAQQVSPMVSTLRMLVVALRQMGYDVTVSDIVDVGEKLHRGDR
jgi:hypothetical protein